MSLDIIYNTQREYKLQIPTLMKDICKICLTLAITLLVPKTVIAQSLSGIVKDSEGTALEMANISVFESGKGFITGCASDSQGAFHLELPDSIHSCLMVTTYLGMIPDSVIVNATEQKPFEIVLENDESMLGEVVVTAARKLFKNHGDVIVADVQNTLLSKAGTINNLLNQIPFVSGSDGDFNVFGRGKAQIYVNGRKLLNADELKNLTSDRIKKVEVITNPGAKYSAEVKSVIKIYTTDNPEGLGGNGMVYMMQGRRFTNIESASLVYNHNRIQYSGSLSYSNIKVNERYNDYHEILKPESVASDDVDIDYNGKNLFANFELNYTISQNAHIGFNTQINWDRITNDNYIASLQHSNNGVVDFTADAKSNSTVKPLKWITNAYYTISKGQTYVELTNDLMLGLNRNGIWYTEDSGVIVSTNGIMHSFLNSFIADANTNIGSYLKLNYGMELSYSREKQTFGFEEENIRTQMSNSNSERRQVLNAEYATLYYSIGRCDLSVGLRYELAQLNYYENEMKSDLQSKTYNDFFPSVNISFSPTDDANISLGYRRTINRPLYGMLNDNLEYHSRYEYVQGNSLLEPEYHHSLNFLGSYKNLRFIGSYDIVKHAVMASRCVFGESNDIILSRYENMPVYKRLQLGVNWWHKFGFYTPYLELNVGKQYFEYSYKGDIADYRNPYVSFKFHHTFSLPKEFTVTMFLDYDGKKYDMFRMHSEKWNTQFGVSKDMKRGWFIELYANNLFCSSKKTSITYCDWIRDATYIDGDNRNVTLIVSYNFNYKSKKHNTYTKSSEMNRF